jgi:hypothetical protein
LAAAVYIVSGSKGSWKLRRQLGAMDDTLAAKPVGILLSLGHIVVVCQEDISETAGFIEPSNQMRQVLG